MILNSKCDQRKRGCRGLIKMNDQTVTGRYIRSKLFASTLCHCLSLMSRRDVRRCAVAVYLGFIHVLFLRIWRFWRIRGAHHFTNGEVSGRTSNKRSLFRNGRMRFCLETRCMWRNLLAMLFVDPSIDHRRHHTQFCFLLIERMVTGHNIFYTFFKNAFWAIKELFCSSL